MSFFQGSMIEALPSYKETSFMKSLAIQEDLSYSVIIRNLLSCSFQIALGYICLDIVFAISLHFIAQETNSDTSAGVGFAYTIVSILLMPMGFGVNQALNCHVSQALGANQVKLSKSYLTLTFYIHLMYFIPVCLIIYFLKSAFILSLPKDENNINSRENTINAAWEYLPLLMISSIFEIQLECFKAYLLAYEVFTPFIFIHFTTTALHLFWCWLFITQLGYGVKGAGYAIILTEVINILLLIGYVYFSKSRAYFNGVQIGFPLIKQAALLSSYIQSSTAMVIHVYADFFVFFLLTIVGIQLGTDLFNAQIAFSNTSAFFFRMPISLSIGLLTYVGSEMGKKRYKVAQKYIHAGILLFFGVIVILVTLLWFLRFEWAAFYAKDQKTQDALTDSLPYFILGCMVFDGFQGTVQGGLKGMEKKNLVTYSTLFAYYVIGIPLILSFTLDWGLGLKLKGLWLGFGVANACLSILYIYSLITADWKKQQDIIIERIEEQTKLQAQRYSIVYDSSPQSDQQTST